MQTWIPDIQLLEDALLTAIENGATIQILILSPDSPFALQRALDLGYKDSQSGPNYINANLRELERIVVNHNLQQHQIEIRTYNVLPSFHLYAADEIMFVGFFWHGLPSKLGPSLEILGSKSPFGSQIEKEFTKIWSLKESNVQSGPTNLATPVTTT